MEATSDKQVLELATLVSKGLFNQSHRLFMQVQGLEYLSRVLDRVLTRGSPDETLWLKETAFLLDTNVAEIRDILEELQDIVITARMEKRPEESLEESTRLLDL